MRIVDCTFRDGGNLNSWAFPEKLVGEVTRRLDNAGVDFIEIGYVGGSGSAKLQNVGPLARLTTSYLQSLPQLSHAAWAVMAVPACCPLAEFRNLRGSSVGLVRLAVYPNDILKAVVFAEESRKMGIPVSLNLMAASFLTSNHLAQAAKQAVEQAYSAVCLADSFGAMTPEKVGHMVKSFRDLGVERVGFHGHNNLGLAMANTLAALGEGATHLDSSLCGMARGAGNTATELLAAVAIRSNVRTFRLSAVLEAAELIRELIPPDFGRDNRAILCGLGNTHFYSYEILDQALKREVLDMKTLVSRGLQEIEIGWEKAYE